MAIVVKNLGEDGPLVSSSESRQIRSGLVWLERGDEVGEHETGNGEELIVVLEGSANVVGEGMTKTASAPAIVLIPPHTRHNVMNRSSKLLRYIYTYITALDGP
jgi:quercetin dioxygenase-like cupin family protein